MQNKKTSKYSKMIEFQDEIEGECVNNTKLWVRSNRRTPPNQTLWLRLWFRPHFQSPSPSLLATHRLRTPPPHLRCALWWILHCQNLSGTLSIPPRTNRQSAKRKGRKEKKEKKRRRRRALNVLEFGGMAGKKKEERRIKKKRVRVHVWRRKKDGKKRKKCCCGG